MEQRKGRRLIIFPLPLQGHLNPMLQLANLLYSKGFSITIIHTHFNSPNPSNHPNFTFRSIPDGLNTNATLQEDPIRILNLLNANCVKPFSDCLSELLSSSVAAADEESIACLITDAIWHFTQGLADDLHIPRLVLRTSSIASFVGFASIHPMVEKGYVPIKGAVRLLHCYHSFLIMLVID